MSLSGLGPADDGLQLAFDLDGARRLGRARWTPACRHAGVLPTDEETEHLQRSWQAVAVAIDTIRARYGGTSVGPASQVTAGGLALRRRGGRSLGPERVRCAGTR